MNEIETRRRRERRGLRGEELEGIMIFSIIVNLVFQARGTCQYNVGHMMDDFLNPVKNPPVIIVLLTTTIRSSNRHLRRN